jgi:lipoprotein signal peptidase
MSDTTATTTRMSLLALGAAVLLCALDRLAKALALMLGERGDGTLRFSLFRNDGIAFSIPVPDAAFWPVAGVALLLIVTLVVRAWRSGSPSLPWLALILLGAASNAYDRIAYGATIDYLIVHRSAVNIADGMIIAGIIGTWWRERVRT